MKIFVFGYMHSGTTILRKVIGDHSQVDEIDYETAEVPEYRQAKHIVFKHCALPTEAHLHCKRVMIARNPWDVMGSLYLRLGDNMQNRWEQFLTRYLDQLSYFKQSTSDYKVRYEDLFTGGGLRGVFKYLHLKYEGPKDRKSAMAFPPNCNVQDQDHGIREFYAKRTAQINSGFVNMTGNSAPHVGRECLAAINSNPLIAEIYHDYKHLSR
jgi:hypothetical protein